MEKRVETLIAAHFGFLCVTLIYIYIYIYTCVLAVLAIYDHWRHCIIVFANVLLKTVAVGRHSLRGKEGRKKGKEGGM